MSYPYTAALRFKCTPEGAIVVTKVDDGYFQIGSGSFNAAADELGDIRGYVGSRLPQAFLNIKVPNCAPIIVTPAGDSVQVQF